MIRQFPRMLWDFYGPMFSLTLARMLWRFHYAVGDFLAWLWSTRQFRAPKERSLHRHVELCIVFVYFALLVLVVWCVAALFGAGRWQLASALIILYPLIIAHSIALVVAVAKLVLLIIHPKKLLRLIVCQMIERQAKRLRRRHNFTVVAVAGSVGKTSTKSAVAQLLADVGLRVRIQEGNYNDRVTVPLALFGLELTSLFNPLAWLSLLKAMRRAVSAKTFNYDVVVLELGSDGPGQLKHFAYLQPDLGLLTAIAPEHMEFFGNLDAVAREETTLLRYCAQNLVNVDLCSQKYLQGLRYNAYSLSKKADFWLTKRTDNGLEGQSLQLALKKDVLKADVSLVGTQGASTALAAVAVANLLGVELSRIQKTLPKLEPFAGRMRLFTGLKNSRLIDDTYNASPVAVRAALDVLYNEKALQKIAILGDMNELGANSKAEHQAIGDYCNPKKINLLVTIGPESKKYLAPQAHDKGCLVKSFMDPCAAGEYVRNQLKENSLVLVKGSQNGVFAEEALKLLLSDPADAKKLVRQSEYWLSKKTKQFPA